MKKGFSIIALAAGMLFASVSFADGPSRLYFNDGYHTVTGGTFSTAPNTFYADLASQSKNAGSVYLYKNGVLTVDATLCADSDQSICRTIKSDFITVNILPDGSRVMKHFGKSKLYRVVTSGVYSTLQNGPRTVSVLDMTGSTDYVLTVAQ